MTSIYTKVLSRSYLYSKRLFGQSTYWYRTLPNFFVLGAERAGTTTLWGLLRQHPEVYVPYCKEINYFDKHFNNSLQWYKSFFPLRFTSSKYKVMGDVTPNYLFHPKSAELIYDTIPTPKFIILLRDPSQRAFSHYKMNLSFKEIETNLFIDALKMEEIRISNDQINSFHFPYKIGRSHHLYSYKTRGLYAEQILRFFKYFSMERFLFVKSEDFFQDAPKICSKIFNFLDLKDYRISNFQHLNQSKKLIMKKAEKEFLVNYYKKPNIELKQLLGDDFSW